MLSCRIVCEVSACIEIGTSWMFSVRRCAVTMIVESWLEPPAAVAPAAVAAPAAAVPAFVAVPSFGGGGGSAAGVAANARKAAPANMAATAYGTLDFIDRPSCYRAIRADDLSPGLNGSAIIVLCSRRGVL